MTGKANEKIHIAIFSRNFNGAKFDKVIANIEIFLELKKARPEVNCGITFVCQADNEHERDDFIRCWHGKMNVQINTLCREQLPVRYNWKPERSPCRAIFHNMIVLTGGLVVPCCRDYEYKLQVGNLAEQSLEEVWNGEPLNALRRAHLESHNHATHTHLPTLCNNCATWMAQVTERKEELLDGRIKMEIGPFWTFIPKQA